MNLNICREISSNYGNCVSMFMMLGIIQRNIDRFIYDLLDYLTSLNTSFQFGFNCCSLTAHYKIFWFTVDTHSYFCKIDLLCIDRLLHSCLGLVIYQLMSDYCYLNVLLNKQFKPTSFQLVSLGITGTSN